MIRFRPNFVAAAGGRHSIKDDGANAINARFKMKRTIEFVSTTEMGSREGGREGGEAATGTGLATEGGGGSSGSGRIPSGTPGWSHRPDVEEVA